MKLEAFVKLAVVLSSPVFALATVIAQLNKRASFFPASGDFSLFERSDHVSTLIFMLTLISDPAFTDNVTGGAWADAYAKAVAIVAEMTIEEKVNLTSGSLGPCSGNLWGVPRLGIPRLCFEDGPAGVRPVYGVSQFPAGLTTAATWDHELIYNRSGVHIALAPVTGGPLGRSPLDGRNWEGWFVDPYATGIASYLSVKGVQDSGVAAVAKHYIGYEQETFRNPYGDFESSSVFPVNGQLPISSDIDDKTTHEVYLWSFAEAVRAGISHVMCSCNEVNQTFSCNNAYTLNHLLKNELNFQGSVISDWGAQHNNIESAFGGLDVSMPGNVFGGLFGDFWGDNLVADVKNGSVPEYLHDQKVYRVLMPYYHLGQNTTPLPEVIYNANVGYYDQVDRTRNVRQPTTPALIRAIGNSGLTLLKNTGGLPLSLGPDSRVAVLGTDATDNSVGPDGCGAIYESCPTNNINGTLTLGGGSGYAYAPYVVTPLDAIKARAYVDGFEVAPILRDTDVEPTVEDILPISDATIVFVSRYSQEGEDLVNLTLNRDGDALVAAAVSQSANVIVVMHTTGVVDIEAWADHQNVTAIIAAFLPGMETGNSLADVLFGDVAPSGKLPFTWGKSIDDYPFDQPNTIVSDPVYAPQSNFTEGVFIDYRWFDKHDITPRYEFGFGLSYTTFEYSDIAINTTGQNTGDYTGSEVAQLYVSLPGDDQPVRMLRGFDKVKNIAPGACATATFDVRRKDVSIWSVERGLWYVPSDEITISVGASSRNLPLTTTWKSS
ncbi:glycoside hydrolase [Fistulina hepatica ATCC 64428]|uniref:Probable beta-glucosidase G n=1 Tax=Fistulina hepatica ATCC 64428 TaxID=1128425 RepID=A0A0D7AA59_9AGAR|nr:glycoside hydrolase [Fistulina hepatica ATCC 64428]